MKKVEKKYFERICTEVFYVDDKGYKVRVDIYPIHQYGTFGSKIKEYGINWGGCGTMDILYTKNYIRLLEVAIEECEKNNSLL